MEQTALDRLIIYLESTAKSYESEIAELTGKRNGILETLSYTRMLRADEKGDLKRRGR